MTFEFWENDLGAKPVEEFILEQPPKVGTRILKMLADIEKLEGRLHSGYFKKLSGTRDLWEVRIDCGNLAYRFLGCMAPGNRVLLVHGLKKKSPKLPIRDIESAERIVRQLRFQEGMK